MFEKLNTIALARCDIISGILAYNQHEGEGNRNQANNRLDRSMTASVGNGLQPASAFKGMNSY